MRVAILGATSQIAKNLISFFCLEPKYELFLFARNETAVREFLSCIGAHNVSRIFPYSSFSTETYEVVINCVGIADPRKQRTAGIELFRLTERFDDLILNFLESHDKTLYISFSSGAIYGTAFEDGVSEDNTAIIDVNKIEPVDYYRIAKLNSEAKHRAMSDRKIIDLRVFSFFSRFIDLEAGFLLCEMTRCVKEGRIFYTNATDIVRDYVAPSDLFSLIELCLGDNGHNIVLDVYSAKPVRKCELIDLFTQEFGLETQVDETSRINTTGEKLAYYSTNRASEKVLRYTPKQTAISSVYIETKCLLSGIMR
jgi:hypothetical protein